jgi:LmbE family N-acetylglucosaminyl deacetylase
LVQDVRDIMDEFKPNIVVTTGFNDTHPDHSTAFYVVQRAKANLGANWSIYASIIHYYNYPPTSGYLLPPWMVFGNNWYSLGLTSGERKNKLVAAKEHASQYANPPDRALFDNLTAKNEIFQKE